jgi:hypothetical protein
MQQKTHRSPQTRIRVHYTKDQVITWLQREVPSVDWSILEPDLPAIIWRHRWEQLAEKHGLPFSRGTMQNRDCYGTGPGSVKLQEVRHA